MAILRFLLLLALVPALAACATAAPDEPAAAYYVVRHFDTPEGARDPDLTPRGQARAERLAAAFPWAPPRAIYVTDYRRTRQTVAPLAARLGLTPVVYDPADPAGLIARVRGGPLPALIVGHSNTVPDIVAALGGERPAPLVHEDFGDLWRVGPGGATERVRID